MSNYVISVIVTSYNAEDSIDKAIASLLNTPDKNKIEVIVVDDCSKDNSFSIIKEIARNNENVKAYQMDKNTGSPSGPRNFGVKKAKADYLAFLDDDDSIDADKLLEMVNIVIQSNADFARGYLQLIEGSKTRIMNRIFERPQGKEQTITAIIKNQSTTPDYIVSRKLLLENSIAYRDDIKIGEDTILTSQILCKAKNPVYIDKNYYLYNKTVNIANPSSTQSYKDREVNDQITAWEESYKILSAIGVNYYSLRLAVGFRYLLTSLVKYSDGISEKTYIRLADFALKTKKDMSGRLKLSARYEELYNAILSKKYTTFCHTAKKRLLITGYDLKFILPVVKYLQDDYNIIIDEWTGHDKHDESKSAQLSKWADIIFCEWLLGNAVYYSKKVNSLQKLVIRAHRFEITRDFGHNVDWNKVSQIYTVGYYYYEQFLATFPIPRGKMRLLSNYVEQDIYDTQKTPEADCTIGIVGILPKRKGFAKGVEVLENLRRTNDNFNLTIKGKSFNDLPWIKNQPEEYSYYLQTEQTIEEKNLTTCVRYAGHMERSKLYTDMGYVLSLSDDELPESFHLAIAEGLVANCTALTLNWPGVEYIYPEEIICSSLTQMEEKIFSKNTKHQAAQCKEYIADNYSMDRFLTRLKIYLKTAMVGE